MAGDQVRLQPEFISLALLLVVTAWPRLGLDIGRWHLVTLWGWAGVHKILSLGWPLGDAVFIADALGNRNLRVLIAVVVPATEIGLAALALWGRSWPVLRAAAPAFHVGTVGVLALAHWNAAVWPWNLALAAIAPLVFQRGDEPTAEERWQPPVRLSVAGFLVVFPAGFYVGVVDAYPAHNLYTSNTATGLVCSTSVGCRSAPFDTWDELSVPFPPEPRLYRAWFARMCTPGEQLLIAGINTRIRDRPVEFHDC